MFSFLFHLAILGLQGYTLFLLKTQNTKQNEPEESSAEKDSGSSNQLLSMNLDGRADSLNAKSDHAMDAFKASPNPSDKLKSDASMVKYNKDLLEGKISLIDNNGLIERAGVKNIKDKAYQGPESNLIAEKNSNPIAEANMLIEKPQVTNMKDRHFQGPNSNLLTVNADLIKNTNLKLSSEVVTNTNKEDRLDKKADNNLIEIMA